MSSRTKQKTKKFRFLKVFLIACLIILLGAGGFLYGTKQGLDLRRMIIGSVLTSSHPNYVDYMHFLLSKAEIDELKNAKNHPKVVQSKLNEATTFKKSNVIKTEVVKNGSFTATVMIISDPTTIHLGTTKYNDKGQPLSELITDNNGVAGINGGGFLDRGGNGSGGQPTGIVLKNGKILHSPTGGNDVKQLIAGFLKSGEFVTGNYSANELVKLGVQDAVHFGPQLIVNGKNVVSASVNAAWGWAPRTALGQREDGSIVMIVTDGRFYWEKTHRGATMGDIAQLFESYHVTNAMAMDGGASTTMIKDGKLLNKPTTQEKIGMRYLPNGWVVIPN